MRALISRTQYMENVCNTGKVSEAIVCGVISLPTFSTDFHMDTVSD